MRLMVTTPPTFDFWATFHESVKSILPLFAQRKLGIYYVQCDQMLIKKVGLNNIHSCLLH